MRRRADVLNAMLAACFFSIAACASSPGAHKDENRCDLAITNVEVVDIENAAIRRHRTIAIGGGRILSVTRSRGAPAGSACTQQFDGGGRYLSPGLNDAHAHLETNAFTEAFGLPHADFDYEAVTALYLARGVTGVRIMSGAPDLLTLRKNAKDLTIPFLLIASPMLSGSPPIMPEPLTRVVTDKASARAAVDEFVDAGYDFIKIRSNLSAEVYGAVLAAARRRGVQVDGHLTRAVGAYAALRSGQDGFAHLNDFAAAIKDAESANEMTAAALNCGCFFETTLSVTKSILEQLDDYDAMFARQDMRYLNPLIVNAFWRKPNNPYFSEKAPRAYFEDLHEKTKALLKKFVEAGIPVIAGSDAMNPMIIPGDSLHDELQMMVEAGLTLQQALESATTEIADHVDGFEDVGRLEKGRRANAVLVDDNPLENLETLRNPRAVIVGGRLLVEKDIHALLNKAQAQGFRN